jgi:hypothetical protein
MQKVQNYCTTGNLSTEDYMSNKQNEIDKLVYEMYGVNKEDIHEIETWYARRYPKLARFCEL